MNCETEIELLESEWLPEEIASISIETNAAVPRRIVSLLWYVPLFMEWQTERVAAHGGDVARYRKALAAMTNEIERILGVR